MGTSTKPTVVCPVCGRIGYFPETYSVCRVWAERAKAEETVLVTGREETILCRFCVEQRVKGERFIPREDAEQMDLFVRPAPDPDRRLAFREWSEAQRDLKIMFAAMDRQDHDTVIRQASKLADPMGKRLVRVGRARDQEEPFDLEQIVYALYPENWTGKHNYVLPEAIGDATAMVQCALEEYVVEYVLGPASSDAGTASDILASYKTLGSEYHITTSCMLEVISQEQLDQGMEEDFVIMLRQWRQSVFDEFRHLAREHNVGI